MEREEAERQNTRNLSDSQSKIKEIIRLRKEVEILTANNKELKSTVEIQKDDLKNFYSVKPTRSELLVEIEKLENKIMAM